MQRILLLAGLWLASLALHAQVPEVHTQIKQDAQGVYWEIMGERWYARSPNDKFTFTDLYTGVKGTDKGLAFNFRYPGLEGTLYYGFINYGDARYPQPVFFKRTAPISGGKAEIDIANQLSGKYDMIGWETSGQGVLGYRIVMANGQMLYDGKAAFTVKEGKFTAAPTVVEGPFVNLLTHESAVISFTTSQPVKARITINEATFTDEAATTHHEIRISGLQAQTTYEYTLNSGPFAFSYTLETAPQPGSRTAFTFAYASDSRAGQGGGERNIFGTNAYIMKKIAALARAENAKFMQFSGDLINGYETSRERMQLQYANWKHAIESFAHHFPVVAGFGNHEAYNFIIQNEAANQTVMINQFPYADNSGESLFQENFVNPLNGPESEDWAVYDPNPDKQDFPSYKETAFWYRYDNVAMVVLNSNYWFAPRGANLVGGNRHAYIMDKQLEWFERTLDELENEATIDHVFVTLHTPFFPNGGHVGDDMWYNGSNEPRAVVGGQPVAKGIIERRDQLLDIMVNQNQKPLALFTGDEHNFNMLPITPDMPRYPADYTHEKTELTRNFYQINNGAAGAPYYAREKTPWMDQLKDFSTQNALVLVDVDGSSVKVRVKNPDTLEPFAEYTLR